MKIAVHIPNTKHISITRPKKHNSRLEYAFPKGNISEDSKKVKKPWLLWVFLLTFSISFSNKLLAAFTVNTVSVSSQSGSLIYGTAGSVTYTLTLGMTGSGGGTTDLSLNWTPPTGAIYAALNNIALTGDGQTVLLTINTTSSTPAGNTSFTVTSSNGSVTSAAEALVVGQKPLTITATGQTKFYGTNLSLGTIGFSAIGLVNSDAVSSVSLASAGATNTASVGSYPITPSAASGSGLSNYTISYNNGNLTVNPFALTVHANNVSKSYGTSLTGGSGSTAFTTIPGTLPNSETIGTVTVAYGSGASASSPVGTYSNAIVPSAATGGTFDIGNYNITYTDGNITVTNAGTSVAVTSTLSPACVGSSVTLYANIISSLSNVTGTVQFFDGATSLGTVTVASNQATLATTSIPVGIRNITAVYSGDANNTGSTSPVLSQEIKANPTIANAGSDQSVCGVNSVTLAANTPAIGTGTWTVATGTGGSFANAANPGTSFTGTIGNSYTLRWTISNGPCVASFDDATIVLKANPTVTQPANINICHNGTVPNINFTGTGTTYAWTNNNTSIGLAAAGTGNISTFVVTNTSTSNSIATISVTPSANGCTGTSQSFTITVKPEPSLSVNLSSQTVCSGSAISSINLTSNLSGSSITWVRDNTAGITGSGVVNPITDNTSSITGSFASTLSSPTTVNFQATATKLGCASASYLNFAVTVNPVATVNPIGDVTYCKNNSIPAIAFSSSNATSYTWTNTNTSIGLAASGSGNSIPTFSANNTGLGPINGTVAVTPYFTNATGPTCAGTPGIFNIFVNPKPVLTSATTSPAVCSGVPIGYIPTTSATGVTISYEWDRAPMMDISPASAYNMPGGINEALTYTGTGTANVQYQYLVKVTNNGVTCNSNSTPVTVPIKAPPKVMFSPSANQTVCSGSSITPIIISNSPLNSSSTDQFRWTRQNHTNTPGIAQSGSGNSAGQLSISGTLSLATGVTSFQNTIFKAVSQNAATGCISDTAFLTIRVNPPIKNNTIDASQISQVAFCSLTEQLTIATPIPTGGSGTYTYQWQVSSDNVSFSNIAAPAGTASTLVYNIASFTNYYFRRVVASGTCNDVSPSYYITASGGTPSSVVGACTGNSGMDIWVIASYAGATYTLQRQNGSSWIDVTTLTGDGDSLNFEDIRTLGTYRIEASVGSSCKQVVNGTVLIDNTTLPASPTTTTYTLSNGVTPGPVCSGGSVQLFATVSDPSGSSNPGVTWYDVASGGTNLSATPTPVGSGYTVTPPSPVNNPDTTVYYYAKSYFITTGCKSAGRTSLAVIVRKKPVMSSADSIAICSGNPVSLVLSNNVGLATNYAWIAANQANVNGESTTTKTTGTINDVLTNTTNTSQVVSYTVIPTIASTGCVGAAQTVKVAVDVLPIVTNKSLTVCSSDSFYIAPANGGGNTIPTSPVVQYTWSAPSGTGFSNGVAGTGTRLAALLNNTTVNQVTALYNITPTVGACTGMPFTATININPKPVISNQTIVVCNNNFNTPGLTPFTGTNLYPTNTRFDWLLPTGSNISGLAASSGNPTTVSGTLINTTSSPKSPRTAVYTVIPTAPASLGGCVGAPFTVSAIVNPTPAASVSPNATVCPGSSTNVTFTGSGGTAPYTFYYNINGSGATSVTTSSGNSVSVPVLTGTPGTFIYNLTGISDALSACKTNAVSSTTVTVTQLPVISNISSIRACSGNLLSVTPVNGLYPTAAAIVPAGTTYSWNVPSLPAGISGASSGSAQPEFSQTLVNNTTTVKSVTYTVTPSNANGCAGAPFTVTIDVDPSLPANTAIWTGSQNNDWCNPFNWACGLVPNASSISAVIPSGTPNQPSITGSCNATVKDLDLQGSATINLATGHGLTVYGSIVNPATPTRYTFNGTVTFAGTNQQIPGFTYNGLGVSGGGIKTLMGNATVNGNLSLINGVVVTSTSAMLTAGVTANVSAGSSQSYIQGPLTRLTNSTNSYTFPVGLNGDVRNVTIVPQSNTVSSYMVYYHNNAPTVNAILDVNLGGLQTNEYWDVNKNYGTDAVIGLEYRNPNGLPAGAATSDWSGGTNPCATCNVAVAYGTSSNNWYFTGNQGSGFAANEATYWQSNNTVFSKLPVSNFGQFAFGYGYSTILPVKLIVFNGKLAGGNNALLDWQLTDGDEVNTIELQHSANGRQFERLYVLAGGRNTYNYTHQNLQPGSHFYRLVITDKSGNTIYSNTILIRVNNNITVIKGIRPTVVRSETYIDIYSLQSQQVSANIIDMAGRVVAQVKGGLNAGENNFRLNVSNLSAGVYTVHVVTTDKIVANLRIMKE